MAARILWWLTLEEAVQDPDRVIAQVMELGDFDDVMALQRRIGSGEKVRRAVRLRPRQ